MGQPELSEPTTLTLRSSESLLRGARICSLGLLAIACCVAVANGSNRKSAGASIAVLSPTSTARTDGPYKLGVIAEGAGPGVPYSNLAIALAGTNGAVKAINASGGVNGHRLDIIQCNTENNPNGAAACGREMVSDGVVAVVGSITQFGAQVIPILDAARIPTLGQIAIGSADLANPDGFPFAPAGIGAAVGEPALAASLGKKKISEVRVDLSVTASLPLMAAIGLAPHGLKLVHSVAIPMNSPDMSSYVAAASANGTDGISILLQPADLENFVKAAKQSAFTGALVSDSAHVLRDIKDGFTSTMNGVYAVDECLPASDTANPDVAAMDAQINAVDPTVAKDYTVEDAWASIYLFKRVATGMSDVTGARIIAAMPTVTNFTTGVFPLVNFSQPIETIRGLHIFNPDVVFEQVRHGVLVPLTGHFTKILG
jgi:ABC-type branched-subunit amino acid transport system substrate-binding protein